MKIERSPSPGLILTRCLGLLLLAAAPAAAAVRMERSTLASGGWVDAGPRSLFGSIGQTAAGGLAGPSRAVESGFMAGIGSAVELVVNGGFEEPAWPGDGVSYSTDGEFTLPGWNVPGGPNQFFLEFGEPFGVPRFNSGRQAVAINSDGSGGELSQTLRTQPGAAYRLRFAWAEELASHPSPTRLEVVAGPLSTNLVLGGRSGFSREDFEFVAVSNLTSLRFIDRTPANEALHSPFIDDVSVVGPPSIETPARSSDHLKRWFYSRGSNAVYQVYSSARDGSDEQRVTVGRQCRLSPDGRWLVVERDANEAGYGGDLWLRNMITGQEKLLVDNGDWIVGFGWFPDSTEIIYDYAGSIRRVQVVTGRNLETALRSDGYDDAPAVNPRYPNHFVWHNINQGIGYGQIYTNSLVNGEVQFPEGTVRAYAYPDWSADGYWTAYTDGHNLYAATYPFRASQVKKLTTLLDPDSLSITPRWHSDGLRVFAAGTIGGRSGIYEVPAVGGPPVRVSLPEGAPIAWIGHVPNGGTPAPPPAPRITLKSSSGVLGRVIVRLALPVEGNSAPEFIDDLGALGVPWKEVAEPPAVEGGERVWELSLPEGVKSRFFRVRGGG